MYENDMKIIERAQNGSKEDMTKLIEDNSRLVWSIVRRFNGRGYDIEDLYQIGSIGLIKAIQRFDTSFEVRLSTYAVPYILGEIKRFIRDDGPIKISRSIKELNIKWETGHIANWSMVLNQLMVDDCFKNRINKYIEY